jgi:excisionase family DNA binding protein
MRVACHAILSDMESGGAVAGEKAEPGAPTTQLPGDGTDELYRQLRDELGGRLALLRDLLLPDQPASEAECQLNRLLERVDDSAAAHAARLAGDDQEDLDRVVAQLLATLWPGSTPPNDWWRSPLGRACARSTVANAAEAMTYSQAAALLGVHRGTVSQLVSRGTLERHPAGGVVVGAVMHRLARGRNRGTRSHRVDAAADHRQGPRRGLSLEQGEQALV